MRPTENRSEIEDKKIVIFGAGKIGRSFIGQLFGRGGYRIIFIDVDQQIIDLLNKRSCYRVVIKGDTEEEILVTGVRAIHGSDVKSVCGEVATAAIIAVSVGKNAMERVIPVIAEGLKKRFSINPDRPLDIILAENMRSASDFMRERLQVNLPPAFPLESYAGLIETSIGKMVPIIPLAEVEKDPLVVFAEPYNSLILDGKGFRNKIPDVKGLAPKNNIRAWVDRKAFIHNLGHATAAYYGFFHHPEAVYMYEVLDDPMVYRFTRDVMLQSAMTLSKVYSSDFTLNDLVEHIDDLLHRFMNKALMDTVFRVGQDLPRKLGSDDRFMGSVHLAIDNGRPYELILNAMAYGFFFMAKDESGKFFPADESFRKSLMDDFESTLLSMLHFHPGRDRVIIQEIKRIYRNIKLNR